MDKKQKSKDKAAEDRIMIQKNKNCFVLDTKNTTYCFRVMESGHLCVTLKDRNYHLTLELHYYVYEDCDVITRSAKLINESAEMVQVRRLMSMQIDFGVSGFVFTTFTGAWAREMKRTDVRMLSEKHVNASYTGTSSSRANPFVMLGRTETSEEAGDCYGFNLIYSGNHYEAVEVSGYG